MLFILSKLTLLLLTDTKITCIGMDMKI